MAFTMKKTRQFFILLLCFLFTIAGCFETTKAMDFSSSIWSEESSSELLNDDSMISLSKASFFEESSVSLPSTKESLSVSIDNQPSEKTESFLFFTDPHLYYPNSGYDLNENWYNSYLPFIQQTAKEESTEFVLCGGDLLNNGDNKEQAFYKINFFAKTFYSSFDNFYILVGNHDTNYQGDTYISSNDYKSCMLSQEEINLALNDGRKSYYSFSTHFSQHYCFDSGIDWDSDYMNDYRWEQIEWFANDLLLNEAQNISLFIHIAFFGEREKSLTAFMKNIGVIVEAFNKKEHVMLNDCSYDYSSSFGHIDFIQAGHLHQDMNDVLCGGIPVIITTSFTPFGGAKPTLDIVSVNYENRIITCKRLGEGENRTFAI